ncbi:MAG: 50S ribosomal protein L29 [Candidatus Paceibacterota bacterium]|jgi:large subunit ribosomal protein L29|nr:50S ribosomal protein L29 [Candidatus Paceibacterota bacterium]MDD5555272.1 50S ribosomal protein L29 [Candidatus Paceibacterota bacterium]
MKAKELKDKNEKELRMLLEEKSRKIEETRFKGASGGLKNVKEIKENKKDIARILTILNQK